LAPSGDTAQKPDRTPSGDGQDKLKKTVAELEKAALEEKPDPAALLAMVQQLQKLLEQLPGKTTGTDGERQKLRQAMKALEGKLKSLPESVPLGKTEKQALDKLVGDFRLALQKGKQPLPFRTVMRASGTDRMATRQDLTAASSGQAERVPAEPVRGRRLGQAQPATAQTAPSKTVSVETHTAVRQVHDSFGQRTASGQPQGTPVSFASLQGAGKARGTKSAAEVKQVFSQIVERARITHKSGMSEMRLQLNPKSLGKVGMRLVLQDGAVTARLSVANSEIRELIAHNLDSLQRELREAGINLANLDLTNQGGNELFRRQIAETGEQFVRAAAPVAETVRETPVPARRSRHEGNVDVVA
jgi:flagellar hook-length control protein FliK